MYVHSARKLNISAAADCLHRGGVLIFPTETFFALGCLACCAQAVGRVYQLKGRAVQQPLPLLAADMDQVNAVMRPEAAPPGLLSRFWPGPLSVLLPVRLCLPKLLLNTEGKAAVRVTSHPLAAELALRAGGLLTASSANMSGRAPVCERGGLDPELLDALGALGDMGGILEGGPAPTGGAPSSLVEPLDGVSRIRLLRAGAVSAEALAAAGFVCE
ncbi:MAG: Sua5/YciO/YrdC/YwlC family protein [Desulfovibrio sp.]|jgi:L-threonylcarbamoyladenylate synthase|nr:Sua5/YciO/YrdC/YwlC family protein [Desulfovibrio sp.]